MAESAEHHFIKTEFLNVLSRFSTTKLYGYSEAERKKYDMSCVLFRDWERPLVGQTLWSHDKGIDKDLRTLLTSDDADIWAYVIKDTVKNKGSLYEAIQDFKKSKYRESLFKLKVFWMPSDFDADKQSDQQVVSQLLKSSIVDDLLFNIVFGNLTEHDFRYFIKGFTGRIGLQLAILSHIAVHGLGNYQVISDTLKISKGPLRERIGQLQAKGFLTGMELASYISLKGRVLLAIIRRFIEDYTQGNLSPELVYILGKLNLSLPSGESDYFKMNDLDKLLFQYRYAQQFPGFTLDETRFQIKMDY